MSRLEIRGHLVDGWEPSFSSTAASSNKGVGRRGPIERLTMFSDHDSATSADDGIKALGPNAGRSSGCFDAGARSATVGRGVQASRICR